MKIRIIKTAMAMAWVDNSIEFTQKRKKLVLKFEFYTASISNWCVDVEMHMKKTRLFGM